MAGKVLEVDAGTYSDEVEKSSLPVLIDFWAPWCGPCMTVSPIIDELAETYDGKLKVVKINVDSNQEVAAKFGVRGIPNFVFIKDGQQVNQIVGAVSKEELVDAISQLLA